MPRLGYNRPAGLAQLPSWPQSVSGVEALPVASEQFNETVRYEPDENPPHALTVGAGVQAALSIVAGIVLTPVIIVNVAEGGADYLAWAVFAAMVVSGVTTVLQAVRVWRIGSGHVLMMGTSGAFIAVCVAAMVEGGPATMASLVVVSSLFQFMLASRLSWFRRLLTPVVFRHGDYADSRDGDAHTLRYDVHRAGGCLGVGRSDRRGRNGGGRRSAGDARAEGRPHLGTHHRHSRGLHRLGALRPV